MTLGFAEFQCKIGVLALQVHMISVQSFIQAIDYTQNIC